MVCNHFVISRVEPICNWDFRFFRIRFYDEQMDTCVILPNSKTYTTEIYIPNIERRVFQNHLAKCFLGKQKHRKRYFSGTKAGISNFDTQTRQSEFGHLAALPSVFVLSLIALSKGHLAIFALSTVTNGFENLYPIILQRMHRVHIERLAKLLQ